MTTELDLTYDLPGEPAAAFDALASAMLLRCWYGAPPGWHRVAAKGAFVVGQALRLTLRDGLGGEHVHEVAVHEYGPGPCAMLALSWEGGPLDGVALTADVRFEAAAGGTRAGVRMGPFADAAQAEAAAGFWRAGFARLARMLAGGDVAPYEEQAMEIRAYHDPLGVAAWGVLAGLREAGAPAGVIADVEAALNAHLPALDADAGGMIDAVMRERLAVIDGWRQEAAARLAHQTAPS